MNQHLGRSPTRTIAVPLPPAWREAGRGSDIVRILSVMYLPNEGALEKLHRADPDFVAKAAKREIIRSAPPALPG